MLASPSSADLLGSLDQLQESPTMERLSPNGGTIGVLDTLGNIRQSHVVLFPNASDIITVTFGIHWPFVQPVLVSEIRHGLDWDSTEVELLGAGPAGPFLTNNIGTSPAAGAAAINAFAGPPLPGGTREVLGIAEFPAAPFVLNGSSTVSFFRVTFHVINGRRFNSGMSSSALDLILPAPGSTTTTTIGGATNMNATSGVGVVFNFFTTSMIHTVASSSITNIIPSSGPFIDFESSRDTFGIKLGPEPASAALLGSGALALTGGFWRRRRQRQRQA